MSRRYRNSMQRNDGISKQTLAINSRLTKLTTALRTAVENGVGSIEFYWINLD